MRTLPVFLVVILILAVVYPVSTTFANHAMGMDLSYRCISNNEYEIELHFYQDCGGDESPPLVPEITGYSNSCDAILPPFVLQQGGGWETNLEVSPFCETLIDNDETSCSGGTYTGIKKYVYRANVTLPFACNDWVLGFNEAYRNNSNNLLDAATYNLHVQVLINNTNNLCNNAPVFEMLPTQIFCNTGGNPINFNQGTVEADGDELVYSSITPMHDFDLNVPYAGGFSLANPLNATAFNVDANTGLISFMPNGQEVGVVTLLVEEYRNGELIGSIMRDIQIAILDCNNSQPIMNPAPQNYELCVGETLDINIEITDPDATDELSMDINIFDFVGAAFSPNPTSTNPLYANFSWTPISSDIGYHTFVVIGNDNVCPLSASNIATYHITVYDTNLDLGNDLTYCPEGVPSLISLDATDTYTWTPMDGLDFITANGAIVEASPTTSTTYTVTNSCGASDDILVEVITAFDLNLSINGNVCAGEEVQIEALATPAANYTYQWEPSADLDDATLSNPTATVTENTWFYVTITTDANACIVSDSVEVIFNNNYEPLQILAAQDSICLGDSLQLIAKVSKPQNCGTNGSNCSGESLLFSIGEDGTSDSNISPYNGIHEDSKVQILYTQSDLENAGVFAGTITSVNFRIKAKYSNEPYQSFNIKMGCTNVLSLGDFETGLTDVLSLASYSTQAGWNRHVLDNAFDWDGQSNLLIEVCYDNQNWSATDVMALTTTSSNTFVHAETDGASNCNLSNPTASNKRPDLRLEVCATSPNPPPIVTWTPSDNLSDVNSLNPIVNPSATTTYYASIDDNGCLFTDSITVVVKENNALSIAPIASICEGENTSLSIEGTLPAGATYNWQPNTGLSCYDCPSPTVETSSNTLYEVLVTSPNDCETLLQTEVQIQAALTADAGQDQSISAGDSITLSSLNSEGNISSYQWTNANGELLGNDADLIVVPNATSTYVLTISSTDSCTASDEVVVQVKAWNGLLMPTAFSPNGDGINDVFAIPRYQEQGIQSLQQFEVYNRWGKQVFTTTDLAEGWDGTYKGVPADMGTYVYFLKFIRGDKIFEEKGNVTLIR